MCGICGRLNIGPEQVRKYDLKRMIQEISYRGPDDTGFFYYCNDSFDHCLDVGLGHARLSIIDVSDAGRQPMSNEDGTIWLTYNGEIYNYRRLRKNLEGKGHIFKSNSDTEVILHLYEEVGLEAVDHINGMFAFALWDNKQNRLWVCRDRLGIKPVVYFWNGRHFSFASEIKSLLFDGTIEKKIDYEALCLYFAFNYVPAPYTMFANIKKLEPGHYLIIENGKLKLKKYWDTPQTIDSKVSCFPFKDQVKIYKKRLFEVLSNAVRDRLISDVPLGAFLSGGVDSSIIVALMARYSDKPVKTFSIGYKEDSLYDETNYAREVARTYNTDHHEFKLSYKDMVNALPDILSSLDEPFADSSAIPTFILSKETKKHVTVALSGDGGDELFAGYRSYFGEYWYARYMLIPGVIRKSLIEKVVNCLPESRDKKYLEYSRRLKKFINATKGTFDKRLLSLKEVFPANIRQKILLKSINNKNHSYSDPALAWVQKLLKHYKGDPINRVLYSDLKDSLPGDMLTKVDWMSMRNSLEVRVPFLDHRLVEMAFKIQGRLKLHKGKSKYILKETFKDLLPPKLYRRPKAGFEVPISRWLKTDLKFLIEHHLSEKKINGHGIFDAAIINNLKEQHMSGKRDTSWMLWNLLVFQNWFEKYFS
jgi:asparagine synthase (glutamine-hydrolysing)